MLVKSRPQKEVKKQKLDERVMNQGTTIMENFKTATGKLRTLSQLELRPRLWQNYELLRIIEIFTRIIFG